MAATASIRSLFRRGSYFRLYLLGVAINVIYLAMLMSNDVSRRNLQPVSTQEYQTVWRYSDAGTYVRSARAFLATGTFAGSDGLPDAHRTVGYPAFLASIMAMGGDGWPTLLWVIQAIIFATIYPSLAVVAREWFGATDRQVHQVVLAYVVLGAGWTYTPIPLTDQIFAVCLWGALALGTLAIRRGGAGVWLGHFALLGAAASIRPTLTLFPLAFLALAIALRGEKRLLFRHCTAVFAVQMVLCQAPAIRNYVHHGIWIPSDVMVNNLSDYLAKDVLSFTGNSEMHTLAKEDWKEQPLRERMAAQTEFARAVIVKHPFVTAGVLVINLALNSIETHWIQPMHFFRDSLHCDLKRWMALTPGLKMFHAMWAMVYGGVLLAACCGLWQLVRQQKWALLIFIVIFTLPYLYGATDTQGARFRLYLEGVILLLALVVCPSGWRRKCVYEG